MTSHDGSRRVRVLADYQCHPLWLSGYPDGYVGDIAPEDELLNLSPELVRGLTAWAAEFDAILCWEDPGSSDFPSPEAEQAFAEKGEALARQVARELGPEWSVKYHDLRLGADRSIPAS
ncbi:hypothetical protein OHS33_05240 [Streptomyces sp. NBC_00536]|uniref:hypothetical protein n=1 Tax=Streptomyces sp. NBC_00536 TaxID=2975769 RepID=UPI002E8075BC|nr:hypothetical protein [Streptomyces sp. NBC_00536]WUC77791.1 hypothetical protein OHS33_05240 [Streptomyces sp. NBC_00536]